MSLVFQHSILIMGIATYGLKRPIVHCSENHLKCITRWEGRDGITITTFNRPGVARTILSITCY